MPSVLAEITVDNRNGRPPRKDIFGYQGSDPYRNMRRFQTEAGLTGIAQGRHTAIATLYAGIQATQHNTIEKIIVQSSAGKPALDLPFRPLLLRGGTITSGEDMSYWHTRYFSKIEDVVETAPGRWG